MSEFDYLPETVKDEVKEFSPDDFLTELSDASIKVQRAQFAHFTPQFLDSKTSGTVDVQRALDAVESRRDLYRAEKISQLEGHVKIETTLPVSVFPVGDIHFGSIYTNNELWEHHREGILNTPGAYVVFLHNLVDNGIPGKFPANAMANGVPPHEQFSVMQKWVKELDEKGKVLGAIFSDCHEGWSWAVAGIEAEKLLYGYEGRKFPVIENGGILHLDVQDQEYALGLWHKQGPFNSRFNPEHALRQNRRLYHEGATDAEIGAHYHNTAASASYEGAKGRMKPVQWLRVGTYKGVPQVLGEDDFITDKWSVEKFGGTGQMPGTALLLYDKKHVIDNSLDFETAIEKHMAVRTYELIKQMGMEEKFLQMME